MSSKLKDILILIKGFCARNCDYMQFIYACFIYLILINPHMLQGKFYYYLYFSYKTLVWLSN